MKVRQIIQIVYEQDEYDLYLEDREHLIEQGYFISDYSESGFILCDWIMEEREIDKNRKMEMVKR